MKSLKFFKPALATTLGIVLAWLLSVRPAEAGYTVTLQQVGPDVVATGSGAINLTGLTFAGPGAHLFNPMIQPAAGEEGFAGGIVTGPTSSSVDFYDGGTGPTSFGSGGLMLASSGSGDMVGIDNLISGLEVEHALIVPRGYVSGTFLSNSATYSGKTFATLGVTPGTYVWTWGTGANQNFTLQIPPAPSAVRAIVGDFNGDGHPDYVIRNVSSRQTGIWYLNNNVFIGSAYGPTLPVGWDIRGVADFNRDSHPDYALFNSSTDRTAIWYLSGPMFISSAYGPALPSGWELVATADFNGDGYPDYVLSNATTHQTAIWYLVNNVYVIGGYGPTLPAGWDVIGAADFDGDGHTDYALFNSSNHQTAIWYLSGRTFLRGAYGPTTPSGWLLVATADFNGNAKPDYVLYNPTTHQTAIWYLNNNVYVSAAYGPTITTGWSLVAP